MSGEEFAAAARIRPLQCSRASDFSENLQRATGLSSLIGHHGNRI